MKVCFNHTIMIFETAVISNSKNNKMVRIVDISLWALSDFYSVSEKKIRHTLLKVCNVESMFLTSDKPKIPFKLFQYH